MPVSDMEDSVKEDSMKIEFTKMHGCGNDYVYIDEGRFLIEDAKKPDIVRSLSDRHKGIGSDGVIFICPSEEADFEMDMYNADGSRSEMCGNGIRCVAKYVYDKGMTDKKTLDIISHGSIKHLDLHIEDGKVSDVRVDMGEPILNPELIPINTAMLPAITSGQVGDNDGYVRRMPIKADEAEYKVTCVSMGNPHAVIYVEDTAATDVEGIGQRLEFHPFFPERTNVEFVQIIDRTHVRMRVWERGTGETMACGTGCCALTVASVLNGFCDRDSDVDIEVPGGHIIVNYSSDGHVYMTGPATTVYEGSIDISLI